MKKIIFLFSLLCICHFSFCIEFDPAACTDLSAKIFYINTQQAVLYVSANHYNQRGKEKFYGKSFPHVYGGG